MSLLERELSFYEEHRDELLGVSPGQFALIKGGELIGVFPTLQDAYHRAIERFGNAPILIRQILPADPPQKLPAFTQGLLRARV
jgi:hypothetical protein